ncbi:MAG: hypothetical protein WKF47_17795 [Geodermatophilaceae bacterium]
MRSGLSADAPDGVVNRALASCCASDLGDDTVLMADLCLCEYTDHGHCGIVDARRRGRATTRRSPATPSVAVAQARAGAHVVAPERDDGRTGRRDPAGARRRRVRRGADPGLRRQVRHRRSTARSARPPKAPRSSATAAATS